MAAGWSPAGRYSLTTSKRPSVRSTSPTGRNSEWATTGCSLANAMESRVSAPTDSVAAALGAAGPLACTRVHEPASGQDRDLRRRIEDQHRPQGVRTTGRRVSNRAVGAVHGATLRPPGVRL